jgi:hypothetical protein
MALIVGSFVGQQQAEAALLRLRESGIPESDTVLIANATEAPTTAAAAGVADAPASEVLTAAEAVEAPVGEAPEEEHGVAAGGHNVSEKEADNAVNSAALGAAVGVFIGGGLMGPLGLALGAVAGTGVGLAAILAGRGLSRDEAERYEADVLTGRYLVAVETEGRTPEDVRALMEESGVAQVKVEA